MPIKAKILLYTFKELNERGGRAYDKAREWFLDRLDGDWYSFLIERWQTYLQDRCYLQDATVSFRGFWSQGDGACFYGKVSFFKDFMKGFSSVATGASDELLDREKEAFNLDLVGRYPHLYAALCADDSYDFGNPYLKLVHRGHYSHENSIHFDWDVFPDEGTLKYQLDKGDITQEQYARWMKAVKDYERLQEELPKQLRGLMKQMYRWLEESYEWHTEDEQLIETAEANEWVFYEDGRFAGRKDEHDLEEPNEDGSQNRL